MAKTAGARYEASDPSTPRGDFARSTAGATLGLADTSLERARAASAQLSEPLSAPEAETLRAQVACLIEALPEPPEYRRAEDPARKQAMELLERATSLLARLLAAEERQPGLAPLAGLARVGELAVRALAAIGDCAIAEGDALTVQARRAARQALGNRALVELELRAARRQVYDRTTGVSWYDPRPEPLLTVQLVCPADGCRQPALYSLSPLHSIHRFECSHCHRPFTGQFAEVRKAEVVQHGGALRYALHAEPLGGTETMLQFDDASGSELTFAPRDLVVLVRRADGRLQGVQNLSTGRALWPVAKGACFLATAAYGEEAPELEAFRALRDQVLLTRAWGRAAVRGYYRASPPLAGLVARSALLRGVTRAALRPLHAVLRARLLRG